MTFSTLPGLKVFPLLCLPPLPGYYWPYLSNCVPYKIIHPTIISNRSLCFGISPIKAYWSVINQYMNYWLPWCSPKMRFFNGLRRRQSSEQNLEYLHQYISMEKPQRLFAMNISILKIMQELGCMRSSKFVDIVH